MEKIGLVLSGGMAKGAYQVGALRALEKYISPEQITDISAASVGAMNGLAFSGGKPEQMETFWRSINNEQEKIFLSSAYKSHFLKQALGFLDAITLPCRHFYAPLLSLKKRELLYWDLKKENAEMRRLLLSAAIAFPPFAKPVRIGERWFYDGALVDNIPVCPLIGADVDYIVCMYFDKYHYTFESDLYDKKIIKICFDESETFLSQSFWFTAASIERMIQAGRRKAETILDFVFGGGKDAARVSDRIQTLDSMCGEKRVRVTGDVIVNNFNRLSKHLAKRTILK